MSGRGTQIDLGIDSSCEPRCWPAGRQDQPGVGHRTVLVEGHPYPVKKPRAMASKTPTRGGQPHRAHVRPVDQGCDGSSVHRSRDLWPVTRGGDSGAALCASEVARPALLTSREGYPATRSAVPTAAPPRHHLPTRRDRLGHDKATIVITNDTAMTARP